jgi:hypothetical protein
MLQKPVIFTSSCITEANQLGGPTIYTINWYFTRGKSGWGVNLIFLPHIVQKLKVSEVIPPVFPHGMHSNNFVMTFTFCITEEMFKKFATK